MFHDFIYKSDIIPQCPNCGTSECVTLVDSILNKKMTYPTDAYDTLPVWHCSRCSHVFGTRSCHMDNILSKYYTEVQVEPVFSRMQTESKIKNLAVNLDTLSSDFCNLQQEVKKQKDDILSALRDRVVDFTLR